MVIWLKSWRRLVYLGIMDKLHQVLRIWDTLSPAKLLSTVAPERREGVSRTDDRNARV